MIEQRPRKSSYLEKLNKLHIFIVSLQQDVEKRAAISKILNGFNLEFTFIDTIYGKELPFKEVERYRLKRVGLASNRGYLLNPSEIGCTLSYLSIYQEIIDNR